MVVALDAMGGDFAPKVPIAGALAALDQFSNLEVILVGRNADIQSELKAAGREKEKRIRIEDAPDIIEMTDSPGKVIRSKPNSSLLRAVDLHHDRVADAVVSAGHTGVQMAASYMKLGLIEGVRRPTIGGLFPVGQGRFTLILDVGANTDCKPINLLQFAVMGSVYMKIMMKVENPNVGLLSIGEEKTKGNELVLASHYLLETSGLNFVGNIEGRDLLNSKADVIVCDGFVCNVILKLAESLTHFIMARIYGSDGAAGTVDAVVNDKLNSLRRDFDYSEIGGVPLLGVDGLSIICHGGSTAKAIKNAIREAITLSEGNLANALSEGIKLYDAGMLARGVARYRGYHDKKDEFEVTEDDDD
ncbi:phosphate acyltransferase PlsX [bacterium]|nr:phosphate acyltransferase PlsX [bacterium]